MTLSAATLALYTLASAGQTAPAPAPADVRAVIVPLSEESIARADTLYGGLEAAGVRTVADAARRGIDRPPREDLSAHVPLDRPRAALLAAKAAMRTLDLEGVERELSAALALLLRTERPSTHRDLLADVLLLRAEVALAKGRPADAEHDLLLLARTDTTRAELHPGLHPPQVVAAFASARARDTELARGFVAVVPDDAHPDAEIFVDGRAHATENGRASLELRAGPHLVTVRAKERVGYAAILEVDPTEPLLLSIFLPPPGADAQRARAVGTLREAPEDAAALATLCALSGANAALVVTEAGAHAWSAERGIARVVAAPAADPLTLGRAFVTALNPPAPPPPPPPPPPTEGEAEESSLLGPVLLTTGIVVGIAAVATAVGLSAVLITQGGPPAAVPRPIVGGCCSPQG